MKISFQSTEIHFTVSGQGPVMVWLHGFLESKEIWKQQIDFFNTKFTNISIDLLGHGKTASVDEIHSMELQASAVQAVLNSLKIDSYSIIGHSMGGYVGLALLEKNEDKITHFVLLNSTSYPDTDEKKQNRERAIKIIDQQKNNFVRMGIVNLFSDTNRIQFSNEIETLIMRAQKMETLAIIAALKGMKNRVSRVEVLKNYKGNKLIISGKEDVVIPIENSIKESLLTQSKNTPLKGGHMGYLEGCKELNEELIVFLK